MLLLRVHCVLPARRLAWRRLPFRDPLLRRNCNASNPLFWRASSSSSSSSSSTTTTTAAAATANSHAICSSSSFSEEEPLSSAQPPPPPKLAKRKLALHIGYVGTNYRGLQWQPPSQTAAAEAAAAAASGTNAYRPPVENVLERALHLSGAITPANSGNPAKVGWTRSSRTDAGVHSLSTVVSLRAECFPERFEPGRDPEGVEFAAAVNSLLPDDVRVFSAQRVNGGWCARGMCESREYEYTLPAWILLPAPSHEDDRQKKSKEENEAESLASAVERLEAVLRLYLGQRPFHNFTVRREYRPQSADGRTGVGRNGRKGQDPRGNNRRERLGWKEGEGEGGSSSSSSTSSSSSSTSSASSSSSTSSSSTSSSSTFVAADAAPPSPSSASPSSSSSSSSSSFTAAGSFASRNQDQQSRSVSSSTTTSSPSSGEEKEREEREEDEEQQQQQRPLFVRPLWLEDSPPNDRVGPAHWRRVDSAEIVHRMLPLVPGGVTAVTVRISGGSFMLRQLRHMIGAAVAVARGALPSADVVSASLRVPARISLPLAPPHTLVLTGAKFGAYPEKALAPGEAPPWIGERLELREEGTKRANAFRQGALGEALNELLSHDDWALWARQLDRLAWDDDEVSEFVSRAKEDERLAQERKRERELERAKEKEKEKEKEKVEA